MRSWEWTLLVGEAADFVLRHPDRYYDVRLLGLLFPDVPMLDNFGISADDVQQQINELNDEQ